MDTLKLIYGFLTDNILVITIVIGAAVAAYMAYAKSTPGTEDDERANAIKAAWDAIVGVITGAKKKP